MKQKLTFFLSFMLVFFLGINAQTVIDFETDGAGYTPTATEGSGNTDVFNRTNAGIGTNTTYYWAAEDLTTTDPAIVLDQIDVTGKSAFKLSVDLLTPNTNDWDITDEVLIKYSIDGGAEQDLLWIQSKPDGDDHNAPAAIDTDFDGDGDEGYELPAVTDDFGAGVGDDFETFSSATISLSSNSTLDITIYYVNLTSADEGLYLDNIKIGTETLDWCNLQWPANGTINQGDTYNVYAQAYEDGVTSNSGQTSGLNCWIGINDQDTDPSTWTTWIPASFNDDVGNNDEFMADIGSSLSAGTYYYASRFEYNNGPYTYGGYSSGGGGFWDGTNYVSGVLTVNAQNPVVELPYNRDFETGDLYTDGWSTQLITGTLDWELIEFSGDHFAEMSNYDGGNQESETWLITPGVDLSSASNPVFNFMNACNYTGDDIEVKISADYDGTSAPSTATWTDLSPNLSTGSWNDVFSGDLDISAFVGDTVYIAFKYIGTSSDGKTWQIDDINIFDDITITPTQLVITSVTPSSPYINQNFDVKIEAQDASGNAGNVDQDTEVQLNLATGTGNLSGTITGTILNGTYSTTITGVSYDVAENIELNASVNSGMSLNTSQNYTVTIQELPVVDLPYNRDFETGDLYTDGWSTQLITGTLDWELIEFSGDHFAEMSNYDGGNQESETWLITPGVDLSSASNPVFNFMNACNYTGDDIEVKISADYDGTSAPSTATWTDLSPNLSTGSWNDVFSGDLDISAFVGDTVYIAFKYIGTSSDGKTWQIDDINIFNDSGTNAPEITNITHTPNQPNPSESVSVSATITDDGTINTAELNWGTVSGTYTQTISMTNGGSGDTYTTTTDIPAMPDGTTVYYEIFAEDDETYTTTSAEYSYTVNDIPTQTLFISEYIEGSSYNKAIEIYNGTGTDIDLTDYSVKKASNGGGWGSSPLDLTGTITDGDVYVIAHSSADPIILNEADITDGICNFNGNDAIGLFYNDVLIDVIGEPDNDPGNGWEVAGVTEATAEHTLVRKYPDVTTGNTDWTSSAGTNTDDSEWIVYDQNDFSYIGWHGQESTDPSLTIINPTNQSTVYTNTVTVECEVENFTVATPSNGDGYITYSLNGGTVQDSYTTTFEITGLNIGTYTLTANLVNNSGNPLDPPVTYTVTFYVDILQTVTIYDIQYTTDPSGDSPYADQTIQTTGIVTAIYEPQAGIVANYYIQDGQGPWNGIYVYDNNYVPAVGDEVTITAEVLEYNDLTELTNVSDFNINSSANTLPDPEIITTGAANDEQYEGVLIKVENAECTNDDANYGMWEIDDGSGALLVDDNLYTYTPTVGLNYNVTGLGHYSFGDYKIIPRDENDVEEAGAIKNISDKVKIYPNPVNDVVYIKANFKTVKLFDITGNRINIKIQENQMNLETLKSGIYIAQITLKNGIIVSKKIIKK